MLNLLHDHEQGHLQYDGSLAVAVLEPLYLAAASPNPKILEAALGCLHKLVRAGGRREGGTGQGQGEEGWGCRCKEGDVAGACLRHRSALPPRGLGARP